MDEEGEEDGEAEGGVGVVGCVGYKAFGDFVEGDGAGGLEAYAHEYVFGDVVVVACGVVVAVILIVVVGSMGGAGGCGGCGGRAAVLVKLLDVVGCAVDVVVEVWRWVSVSGRQTCN